MNSSRNYGLGFKIEHFMKIFQTIYILDFKNPKHTILIFPFSLLFLFRLSFFHLLPTTPLFSSFSTARPTTYNHSFLSTSSFLLFSTQQHSSLPQSMPRQWLFSLSHEFGNHLHPQPSSFFSPPLFISTIKEFMQSWKWVYLHCHTITAMIFIENHL